MENHLGRLMMPGEDVHHVNEDKNDDRIENLAVRSKSAHAREHQLAKAPKSVQIACKCGKVFTLKPYQIRLRTRRSNSGKVFCSRSCGVKFATSPTPGMAL